MFESHLPAIAEDSVITTSQPPSTVAASVVSSVGSAAVPAVALDSKTLFLKMFSSRFGSYARTVGGTTWRQLSQFHQLSDEELLTSISKESKAYRALSVDQSESFLVLQFNAEDRTADRAVWEKLSAALLTAGLSGLKLFQVSEGSTYQVFICFSKAVSILPLSKGLTNHLLQAGVTNVEVLKPGNHFILPLQEGYRWMNDGVLPVIARHEMSEDMALNFFMGEVTKVTVCPEQFVEQFKDFLEAERKREIMEIVPPEGLSQDGVSDQEGVDGQKPKRKERRLRILP
ncbi:MAG: hypothetical protein WC028_13110 [Candidatus Obscuribacterales bacterium]